jgi:hypothetical protein
VLIYKKQEELAMTMAILWRKKLVLHSILVGVFIGISENPIMPPTPSARGIPSPAHGGER